MPDPAGAKRDYKEQRPRTDGDDDATRAIVRVRVVPGSDVAGRGATQGPADDRREALDRAEDQAGAQRLGEAGVTHRRPLADGRGERIRRHRDGDEENGKERHDDIRSGLATTACRRAQPSLRRPADGLANLERLPAPRHVADAEHVDAGASWSRKPVTPQRGCEDSAGRVLPTGFSGCPALAQPLNVPVREECIASVQARYHAQVPGEAGFPRDRGPVHPGRSQDHASQ